MQIQAPLVPTAHRAKPRLFELRAGTFFRAASSEGLPHVAHRGVLTLLSHGCSTVSDDTRIWCVVIGAEPVDGVPGEMIGLPRDTPVERLHVISPIHLACEH